MSVAGDEIFSYSGKYFPVQVTVTGVKPTLILIVRTEALAYYVEAVFSLLPSRLSVSLGKYIPR